jgi:hypothetical protein
MIESSHSLIVISRAVRREAARLSPTVYQISGRRATVFRLMRAPV